MGFQQKRICSCILIEKRSHRLTELGQMFFVCVFHPPDSLSFLSTPKEEALNISTFLPALLFYQFNFEMFCSKNIWHIAIVKYYG